MTRDTGRSETPAESRQAPAPTESHGRSHRRPLAVSLACVAVCGAVAAAVVFVRGHSRLDPFALSVEAADGHTALADAIGTPITRSFRGGGTALSVSSGGAEFSVEVRGPKGRGSFEGKASRTLTGWTVDCLVFRPEGSDPPTPIVD